jgi:hypothetical protein
LASREGKGEPVGHHRLVFFRVFLDPVARVGSHERPGPEDGIGRLVPWAALLIDDNIVCHDRRAGYKGSVPVLVRMATCGVTCKT